MADSDGSEWKPPTDAELKVIAARQERSNKISKKMGEYLLKGHKMLASCCSVCSTIEMEDKQGVVYCIACNEIDNDENAKDNPALSRTAASKTLAESAFKATAATASSSISLTEAESEGAAAIMARLPPAAARAGSGSGSTASLADVSDSLEVVIQKLRRVTQALAVSDNVEQSRNYVALIKECADAIISLRKAEA